MPKGAGDKDYKKAFREKTLPKIKEFKLDIILISAGFDNPIRINYDLINR